MEPCRRVRVGRELERITAGLGKVVNHSDGMGIGWWWCWPRNQYELLQGTWRYDLARL